MSDYEPSSHIFFFLGKLNFLNHRLHQFLFLLFFYTAVQTIERKENSVDIICCNDLPADIADLISYHFNLILRLCNLIVLVIIVMLKIRHLFLIVRAFYARQIYLTFQPQL